MSPWHKVQTVLNKFLGLKGHRKTPCDAYIDRLESHFAALFGMREVICSSRVWNTGIIFQVAPMCHRKSVSSFINGLS